MAIGFNLYGTLLAENGNYFILINVDITLSSYLNLNTIYPLKIVFFKVSSAKIVEH